MSRSVIRGLSEQLHYDGSIAAHRPHGIFKPAGMRLPLSITTAPIVSGKDRPYDDEIGADDVIRYRYREPIPATATTCDCGRRGTSACR
jgi:hypothetical protein